eukprot:scaffold67744_cov36-Phaeocystis_antarctica.AAC.2
MGHACQPHAYSTYRRHRAACSRGAMPRECRVTTVAPLSGEDGPAIPNPMNPYPGPNLTPNPNPSPNRGTTVRRGRSGDRRARVRGGRGADAAHGPRALRQRRRPLLLGLRI